MRCNAAKAVCGDVVAGVDVGGVCPEAYAREDVANKDVALLAGLMCLNSNSQICLTTQ